MMLRLGLSRRFFSYGAERFLLMGRSFPKGRRIVIVGGVAGGGSAAARCHAFVSVYSAD